MNRRQVKRAAEDIAGKVSLAPSRNAISSAFVNRSDVAFAARYGVGALVRASGGPSATDCR